MNAFQKIYSFLIRYVSNPIVLILTRRTHIIIPIILSILFFAFVSPFLMRLATDVVGGTGIAVIDKSLRLFCGLSAYIKHSVMAWDYAIRHSGSAGNLSRTLYTITNIILYLIDIVFAFPIALIGVIICLFLNLGLLVGHGCSISSVHFLSYKSFFWSSFAIGTVLDNILTVFLLMYLVTHIILRPFGRWVFVPSLLNIWWLFFGRRRNRMKRSDEDEVKKYIPEKFDRRRIELGLQKYRSDQNLLSIYLSRLADEFRTEQEIKFIQKQMSLLNIQRSYLEEIIASEKTKHRYDLLDKEKSLDEKRMDSEIKKMDRDIDLDDLEKEAMAEELKTRIARAKFEREKIGKTKEAKETTIDDIVNDIKNQSISIVKAKEEIMNTYPPDVAEQIIDELERRMVEQDIQKKGRYQSGS